MRHGYDPDPLTPSFLVLFSLNPDTDAWFAQETRYGPPRRSKPTSSVLVEAIRHSEHLLCPMLFAQLKIFKRLPTTAYEVLGEGGVATRRKGFWRIRVARSE